MGCYSVEFHFALPHEFDLGNVLDLIQSRKNGLDLKRMLQYKLAQELNHLVVILGDASSPIDKKINAT